MSSAYKRQQGASAVSKPSELAITIAVHAAVKWWSEPEGWVDADMVRGQLDRLGFRCSTQQVGAWLARMARTEAPWVERQEGRWGTWEYRVTRFGKCDIDNKFPVVKVSLPWALKAAA